MRCLRSAPFPKTIQSLGGYCELGQRTAIVLLHLQLQEQEALILASPRSHILFSSSGGREKKNTPHFSNSRFVSKCCLRCWPSSLFLFWLLGQNHPATEQTFTTSGRYLAFFGQTPQSPMPSVCCSQSPLSHVYAVNLQPSLRRGRF